jgi:hypothetical protein
VVKKARAQDFTLFFFFPSKNMPLARPLPFSLSGPRAPVLALLLVLDVLAAAAETGWETAGFAVSFRPDAQLLRRACGGRFHYLANSMRNPRIDRRMNAARLAMNKGEKKIAKGRCIPSLTHS